MPQETTQLPLPAKGSARNRLLAGSAAAIVAILLYSLVSDHLSLDALAERENELRRLHADYPVSVYTAVFCIYVTVTGLSLPGATPMSLIVGWYFGFVRGVILVSFASTLGATIAFLLSRHLFRDTVQSRFGHHLRVFNDELNRDGPFYLFTLRLIPAVPFFLINVVMGLTRIRTWTFWWVSQVGMLAGTIVYLYAGSSLPSLSQLADPSQLRPNDITDWPEFVSRLGNSDDAFSAGAGRFIYRQLDNDSQNIVNSVRDSNASPNEDEKATLLNSLNTALAQPDFALQPGWLRKTQVPGTETRSDATIRKQTTSINRAILIAAMPNTISAPQPILSRRLMLAFVLLGSFPIIVKKLMSRLRNRTPR